MENEYLNINTTTMGDKIKKKTKKQKSRLNVLYKTNSQRRIIRDRIPETSLGVYTRNLTRINVIVERFEDEFSRNIVISWRKNNR